MNEKKIDNLRECREWLKENRPAVGGDVRTKKFWDELFDVMETMAGFLDSVTCSLDSEGKLK